MGQLFGVQLWGFQPRPDAHHRHALSAQSAIDAAHCLHEMPIQVTWGKRSSPNQGYYYNRRQSELLKLQNLQHLLCWPANACLAACDHDRAFDELWVFRHRGEQLLFAQAGVCQLQFLV